MKHLNNWAKGKPLGLIIIAQQLAVGVEYCFEFLKIVKAGERIDVISSIPNVKEWIKLYGNHRKIQKSVVERFKGFGGLGRRVCRSNFVCF